MAASPLLTIVGWLWQSGAGRALYEPEDANVWARMIHRRLALPHRFVLVTDWFERRATKENPFDPLIEPLPLWHDWRELRNAAWGLHRPQCYVRLKAFSREARQWFGERFVSIDLDCIVTGALDPLFDRPEDFLILRRTPLDRWEAESTYQGSMWLMRAGARAQVWEDFQGEPSIAAARRYMGTDQAWIRHRLGPREQGWGEADGVYCFRNLEREPRYLSAAPADARIIFFNLPKKPREMAAALRAGEKCYRCGRAIDETLRCRGCGARNSRERRYEWISQFYP